MGATIQNIQKVKKIARPEREKKQLKGSQLHYDYLNVNFLMKNENSTTPDVATRVRKISSVVGR